MKRSLLLGAVSAMALIAPAQAADLGAPSMKETETTPPPYNWAGYYVGVNGGYAWDEGGETLTGTEFIPETSCWWNGCSRQASNQLDGGFGGGQIGINLQRDRLVYGLEADFQGASVSQSWQAQPDTWRWGSVNASSELDWFGTVRARFGLIPYGNWLTYITGGVAFGGVQDNLNQGIDWNKHFRSISQDNTNVGYVLGAGVEYGWGPAWSAKVEYQYMDLGPSTLKLENPCWCATSEIDSSHSFSTIRVGINYHFVPAYVPLK
ncbi:MAG: outer membrane protein [Rhodomicrobium sp.]